MSTPDAIETDKEEPANEELSGKSDSIVSYKVIVTELCEKVSFKEKMRDILSCRICCELRRCPMYQCKYGHLICAGCFNYILAESQVQNEIASCPSCQTTITKDICYRNVAVEKTISELPVACTHCFELFPPQNHSYHESICDYRPATCSNAVIGCSWKGSNIEKENHEKICKQLSCSGEEILSSLTVIDCQQKKEEALYNKIMDLFSMEKISYSDLQLKQIKNVENAIVKETSIFIAFEHQWLLRVYCSLLPLPSCVFHKLISQTKPNSPLNVSYMILPGPYNDMEIKPDIYQFKFKDKALETPKKALEIPKFKDIERLFTGERINIRIVMFIVN